ncbi:hypothetical protein ACFYV7_23370 [Nocardia suismassiliense]|uniref:Coenzyme PQQ synthesis protein A n=1 Tax=Nocardia suismassiliense TaxID=2077092 RepID=A0ABW6QWZ9_9NOCA
MQAIVENRATEKVEMGKKVWRRPDFAFFDTALEITAYAGRD